MAKGHHYCLTNSDQKQPIPDKKNNMNQTLYLLRHAKAEPWSPGSNDIERRLSQRGHSHMQSLSAWMLEHLPAPEIVLCSPSQRTRETLAALTESWPELGEKVVYPEQLYEATTGLLHSLAEAAFKRSPSVMMVGHNPGFEYLLQSVLRDRDATNVDKMATGTLAVVDFTDSYEAGCGSGILRHWMRRRDL